MDSIDVITQEYKFQVYIGGEEGIDAKDLAVQLKNLDTLMKIASDSENDCKLKVIGAEIGSFTIDLMAVAQVIQTFDVLGGFNLLKTSLETIHEWFEIKKHLQKFPPKSIESEGNKVTIENVKGNVYVTDYSGAKFFENANISNSIAEIGASLSGGNRNCFAIKGEDGKDIINVDEKDYDDISARNIDTCEECVFTHDESMRLIVIKPVLKGNAKWTFKKDDKTIEASIEDEKWKDDFDEGKIDLFAGIGMEVLMNVQYKKDNKGIPIMSSAKYRIKKVYSMLGKNNKQDILPE